MSQKTVVILHGWTRYHERWQRLINLLNSQNFRVLYPILPGFGKTTLPHPWGVNEYLTWLQHYLRQKRVKNYSLIGHSNGGRLAISWAARKPKGLEKLVLIASAGINSPSGFKKSFFWILAKVGGSLLALPLLTHFRQLARNWLYRLAREKDYYEASPTLAGTMVQLLNLDLKSSSAKINIPTLLIWGAQDRTTPLSTGLMLREQIKDADLTIFPDGRHSLPYDEPKKVSQEIINFLKKEKYVAGAIS